MKKLPNFLSTACAAALLLATVPAVRADAPAVGSPAPDFSLPDSAGKTEKLSEYKGKYVVLEWTNPECPFVRKHYESGNMQKLQAEYVKKGVVWLSIDSPRPPAGQGYLTADDCEEDEGRQVRRRQRAAARSGRQGRPSLRGDQYPGHVRRSIPRAR